VTIFLPCGFAAKYREGGRNFSVPLQWMLGLRRLRLDAIWLKLRRGSRQRFRYDLHAREKWHENGLFSPEEAAKSRSSLKSDDRICETGIEPGSSRLDKEKLRKNA
jgi:hypothetical protein